MKPITNSFNNRIHTLEDRAEPVRAVKPAKSAEAAKPVKAKSAKPRKLEESEPDEFFFVDDQVFFKLRGSTSAFAIVSANKWPYVSAYKWYLGKAGYPVCYEMGKMTLHRFVYYYIMGGQKPPENLFVDHADRNKLNNTDQNLRLATPQENAFNKTTKSNVKGVRKISETNYSASITKDGKVHEIKGFATEKEAAECYNMMAMELFGEFAALNNTDLL